ncbi:MAG: class I SAM-dependent methyltransferase [Acidimicrobiia bacterium]
MAEGTKDAYRRIARFYDRVLEPLDAPLRPIAMKLYPVDSSMTVLDIGCGTGSHLEIYVNAGAECHGIDLSPAMLEQAIKRLGDRADLRLGDATALPYDADSFDLAVASLFLHELDPATRNNALVEMARVVRPDGRIMVIDYFCGKRRFKGHVMRAISAIPERIAGRNHHAQYRRYVKLGGVPTMASDAGLIVDREKIVAGGNLALWLLRADG